MVLVSNPTVSFALFPHQQSDDAQETLGCSQV